jgi:predicted nuclease of predicted toxin-antitoxin system
MVLQAAVDDLRVLLTLDTDFGTLLARSGDAVPGVVLFRGAVTHRPDRQVALLLANLDQFEPDLLAGALVVIGDNRVRVRRLPIE